MKIIHKTICLSALLLVLLPAVLFGQHNCEFPSDNDWFSFCIEQDGQPVPAVNGRLTLEKAPFTLVLVTRGPVGILVNCSDQDTLYKGFLKNKPLNAITDEPDMFMGIGEAPLNPDEVILIDKLAPHYFFYSGPDSHRYSAVEERDEWIIGRRKIANYTTYVDGFVPTPIKDLEAETLFFSLMYGEYDKDYNRVEIQKEGLKISFR